MNKVKNWEQFNESYVDAAEDAGLYDKMSTLLDKVTGEAPGGPDDAMEILDELDTKKAKKLYHKIDMLNDEIDEVEAEAHFKEKEDEEDEED